MLFYSPSDLIALNASDFHGTVLRAPNQGLAAGPLAKRKWPILTSATEYCTRNQPEQQQNGSVLFEK